LIYTSTDQLNKYLNFKILLLIDLKAEIRGLSMPIHSFSYSFINLFVYYDNLYSVPPRDPLLDAPSPTTAEH